MKRFLLISAALGLGALGANAQTLGTTPPAQEQTAGTITGLTPEDQAALDAARALMRVTALWNKPLDWKETGASTADILAHIKMTLGVEAPAIELRGTDLNHSTFILTQAPLGPTLSALAELANFKVWVFSGRLVVAPEAALSEDELAAIAAHRGGEWKQSNIAGGGRWDENEEFTRVTVSLVGADLKARLAAKGQTGPATAPAPVPANSPKPPPFALAFTELSPTSQELLRDLWEARYSRYGPAAKIPVLDSSIRVGLDDTNAFQTQLLLQKQPQGGGPTPVTIEQWSVRKLQPQ